MSLTAASRRSILAEPPPDLAISAGHRSVAVVRALRERSGGRTRVIHVGFPRILPSHFDLVIATPQYPMADHPKLLRVAYALTRIGSRLNGVECDDALEHLPPPRRLLIIGGPTLFWKLDEARLRRTLAVMIDETLHQGGSVLVTTSPRTPQRIRNSIAAVLGTSPIPHLLTAPGKRPRYASLLAAADSIRITADSVAMVSDAIWTGKPLAIVPVTKSLLGRAAMALTDAVRQPLYPQDLRRFWKAIARTGVGETLATPSTSTEEEMRLILARVRPILEELE